MTESSSTKATRWLAWTQNAAIFTACVNLFSTALANVGLAALLALFLRLCAGADTRALLARARFPAGLAWAMVLFFGWQLVGLAWTQAEPAYAWKSFLSGRKLVYLVPLALVFTDLASRLRFLKAFLATCAVGLVLSFALAIAHHGSTAPGTLPGGYHAENVFHSYATQGMAFGLCVFLSAWFATRAVQASRRAGLWLLSAAFLANLALVTAGRSGYLAFIALLVAAFGLWGSRRGMWTGLLVAGVAAAAAFMLVPRVHDRVMLGVNEVRDYRATPVETSMGRRMLQLEETVAMVREHPLQGTGTGGYRTVFSARVAGKYTDWKATPFDDPHNAYLFALSENGIIGLATFLWLLAALYRACDRESPYGRMAAACLVAWCATSVFSGHFRTFPEGHMIAFILGILMLPLPEDQRVQPTLTAA